MWLVPKTGFFPVPTLSPFTRYTWKTARKEHFPHDPDNVRRTTSHFRSLKNGFTYQFVSTWQQYPELLLLLPKKKKKGRFSGLQHKLACRKPGLQTNTWPYLFLLLKTTLMFVTFQRKYWFHFAIGFCISDSAIRIAVCRSQMWLSFVAGINCSSQHRSKRGIAVSMLD